MPQIQILLFVIILLGYLTKKFNILKKEDAKPLSTILIDIMLPALIIVTFSKTNLSGQLGIITLCSFIILSVFLLAGLLISKKFKKKQQNHLQFLWVVFGVLLWPIHLFWEPMEIMVLKFFYSMI